jgi:membrane protein DedA with SNARE-associated domain
MEEIGYIGLFFYSLGGGFLGLVTAGILSFAGTLDLTTSIVIAIVANFLGDTMLFYMMRYNKAEMMTYIRKHRRKLALAHIMLKKHGDKAVVIQKFLYGIKTLIPMAIGLTKYDFKRFTIINFFASIFWGLSIGFASYYAGEVLLPIIQYISDHVIITIATLAIVLGSFLLYMEKATKKK